MTAVMDVVCMDHPLQVLAAIGWLPPYALMDNDVMKYNVEQSIAENSDANGDPIWIVHNQTEIVDQGYGRDAEDNSEQVVPFKGMVMYGVVRPMPDPKYAMHDVLVGEPCNKLPEKEGPNNNQ